MQQPEKQKPGPKPSDRVNRALDAVLNHGWTAYRAAKYFGCTASAVYQRRAKLERQIGKEVS